MFNYGYVKARRRDNIITGICALILAPMIYFTFFNSSCVNQIRERERERASKIIAYADTADVDRNGLVDMALYDKDGELIEVLYGQPNGTFASSERIVGDLERELERKAESSR